jgi:single-strand DNA-binding protein
MARSVNQAILLGNLTRDPELRQTPSGQSVCNFGIALNRAYKDQSGNWQEATDFVNCVAWGPLAERINQYLSKGRRVLVQGSLRSSSWEQDGQKRSKVEVWANDVTFLDGRGEGGDSGGNGPAASSGGAPAKKQDDQAADAGDEPINLDDIPF